MTWKLVKNELNLHKMIVSDRHRTVLGPSDGQ